MLYQILPKYDFKFQQDNMRMFLKTLANAPRKKSAKNVLLNFLDSSIVLDFCYIIDCDAEGMLSFYLRINNQAQQNVALQSLQTLLQDKADAFPMDELESYHTVHTVYCKEELGDQTRQEKVKKSLATFIDDQVFLYILSTLQPRTRIMIDFETKRSLNTGRSIFRGVSTDVEAEVLIRVACKTKYQRNIIMAISNNIINLTSGEKAFKVDYRNTYKFSKMTGNELMNLLQLPSFFQKPADSEILKRIHKLEIGQRTLKETEFNTGIECGRTNHPLQHRAVKINTTHLRKHIFITGQTGSGKSSAVEEMMKSIISEKVEKKKNVPGFMFFDPAETSVLGVIDMILKFRDDGYDISELIEKVHYIDFNYQDCIYPISILNQGMPSTEIIAFFNMLYGDQQAIQVERNMSSAISALLLDSKNEYAVKDIARLFREEEFRKDLAFSISQNIYAEDAIAFLNSKFNQNHTDPILNRTDPFLNTSQKKLMFGLSSKHDGLRHLKQWMDDGHIVLFNLKGLNNFDLKIIIGYILHKLYHIGLSREENALLSLIFIDEAHKVQIPIIQKILAELRKQGVAIGPMTQFLEQFDENYLKALLGNVGTKISFRQGDDAGRRLAPNLPGHVDKEALKRLPDLLGYISAEDNNILKSILVKVNPPHRYTDGKLLPFPDNSPGHIVTKQNIDKNRKFGRELMCRDFISRLAAEQIVYGHMMAKNKDIEVEHELLEEGDGLWDE